MLQKDCYSAKTILNGQSAKVYTLKIYPLYGNCVQTVLLTIIHGLKLYMYGQFKLLLT